MSAAGLAVVAGCGTGYGTPLGPVDGPPRRGGTLRLAVATQADSWDPHVAITDIAAMILRPVFDSLVSFGDDGTPQPWLATGWTIGADGLSYTFTLRDDVTFSDGEKFDAHAVKANFDHVVAPETKSTYAVSLLGPYAGTEVVDDHTVTVRLKQPYSSFLYAVSTTFLGFHSPKALRDHPRDLSSGGRYTVASGPFTFETQVSQQEAVFRRREGYRWAPPSATHNDDAYLYSYRVSFVPEDQSRVGAGTSGQIDVADSVPSNRLPALRRQAGLEVVSKDAPGLPYAYYLNTSKAPFNDVAVRRALQAGLDLDGITRGVFRGEYARAWSVVSPVTRSYAADLESTWPYDPAEAARLLDSAGYTGRDADGYRTKDGQRLRVEFPFAADYTTTDRRVFDTALQSSLKRIGFDVHLYPTDNADFAKKVLSGNYDLKAVAWVQSDPALLRDVFHSKRLISAGGSNQAWVRDPQLDAWLDQARATTDTNEQNQLYQQVQRRVIDLAYVVPAYVSKRSLAVQRRAQGLRIGQSGWPSLYDAWLVQS
jgi:peptide/nickel transport system substrate-binding protein